MFELEVVVVVVGLRSEANLLDVHLHLLCLDFLLMLLLLVDELAVVDEPAYRRLCIWRNLYEVNSTLLCHLQGFGD